MDITPLREALGLDETADEQAVLAAVGNLKSKADAPAPTPEPAVPVVPQADVEALVTERVAASEKRLSDAYGEKLAQVSGELAAMKAEKAAAIKGQVLASAQEAGKIAPADVEQWSKDYDEAPSVTTRILASLAPHTAVPMGVLGHSGEGSATDESKTVDAEFEALLGRGAI